FFTREILHRVPRPVADCDDDAPFSGDEPRGRRAGVVFVAGASRRAGRSRRRPAWAAIVANVARGVLRRRRSGRRGGLPLVENGAAERRASLSCLAAKPLRVRRIGVSVLRGLLGDLVAALVARHATTAGVVARISRRDERRLSLSDAVRRAGRVKRTIDGA